MRINPAYQTCALLALFLLSGNLFISLAQNKDEPLTLAKPPSSAAALDPTAEALNEFGVTSGGSWLAARVAGITRDTRLGIVALRYARVLSRGKIASLKYTVDVIPFAVLDYPKSGLVQTAAVKRTRMAAQAAGTAPIGLQANFRPQHRVQPFASLSGGCLFFAQKIPNRLGTRFNFTADLGGGIQILSPSHRALTLGYKLHHISNAERGDINPGFDSNLFYIGISFFK